MIKALIIDDERHNIETLEDILKEHCHEVTIVGTAAAADQAIDLITKTDPDLIFLDIQMPGKNGFDMLRALESYNFEVIFVTAFSEYGINAVKFSAIDYLLKPINVSELKAAVKKAVTRESFKKQNLRLENLIQLLEKNKGKESHRIALSSIKETRFIQPQQIIRCESQNNYTTFYLDTNESIVVSKPIYEYEELLKEYGFVRCHQSHLINVEFIKSVVKQDGGYILMNDNSQIPIGKQKREELFKKLRL